MKSKREVILLSVVGVAVLFFVVDQFGSKKKKQAAPKKNTVEMKTFVSTRKQELMGLRLQPHEQRVLDMLQRELPFNPFARQWVRILSDQRRSSSREKVAPRLSYDGYIRQADRYVVLVNEEDYEVGSQIESVPFVIRQISGEKIEVENSQDLSEPRLSIKITPAEGEHE